MFGVGEKLVDTNSHSSSGGSPSGTEEHNFGAENADDADIMEDMIAEDAVWKRIQQNTFTRWANEHLKTVHSSILDLETDLEDGLRLIALLQVLSGKTIPKHNKKPNFRSQKLENVSVALNFLEKVEGIKLVNIDSSDIVDCKLKLILGLIWHLILHYSISMPVWEGENDVPDTGTKDKGPTPKQRLLNWVQNKVPELGIANFTSDWKDGKAVGALVDSVAPGLCPDWQDWNPKEALQNATEAMSLADEWLDVKQLIKPEEIVNPNIDELSMMTYLSQYPNAKLKSGAPLREKTNPSRIRCYGPGVESTGPIVQTPTNFTIETFSAGNGIVQVILEDPDGHQEAIEPKFNNDRNMTYSCSYTPEMEGKHTVNVFFGHPGHMVQVPRSPFIVSVEGKGGDPSKVECFGPGLEPHGLLFGKQTYFDINVKNAGKGVPEVAILDPNGESKSVPVKLRQISEDIWRCEYTSKFLGLHSVNVFFNREHVPKSPFPVTMSPVCDARKVRATGRGIQQKGVRFGDKDTSFKIYTEGAGEGKLEIKMVGPGGSSIPVALKKLDDNVYQGSYDASKEGKHVIMITYGGQEIPNSPFQVAVGPKRNTGVKVFGPGLASGIVNEPATFVVETHGHTGALGFQIEGPSQSEIKCDDNGDGSANVHYIPSVPGDYMIHILCDDEDIENSPYVATILPKSEFNPKKVSCSGPGLLSQDLLINKATEFIIDTRNAGSAPLCVQVNDAQSNEVPVCLKKNPDGTHKCTYIPHTQGKHTIQVSYGGVGTKDGPYHSLVLQPANPKAIYVGGPGVENAIICGRPTHFNIDAKAGGSGEVALSLMDSKGNSIPYSVQDNGDNTFSVDYTPVAPGQIQIHVLYDNVEVPNSPFNVQVLPHVDVNKIQIQGLEPIVTINIPIQFTIITPKESNSISVLLVSPTGRTFTPNIKVETDFWYLYYHVLFRPTNLGEYSLLCTYGNNQRFAFSLVCVGPTEPGRVRVYGSGLVGGRVGTPAQFMVDTREAGYGPLGVSLEGPVEVPINCIDNLDGTCLVSYLPSQPGLYSINVTFCDTPVPGCPFSAIISPLNDHIKVSGPGIKPRGVFLDSPTEFSVSGVDDGSKLICIITSPSKTKSDSLVTHVGNGLCKVLYTAVEEGDHTIDILYDGLQVPGAPFPVKVQRGSDPSKVKAFGPGLERAYVNQSNKFQIETKGAGTSGLGLAIEGPSEAKMTCKDNRDGSCTVEYIPLTVGHYDIGIKFGDRDIPGSPFRVPVIHSAPKNNVTAHGDGLNPSKVREGVLQSFIIDASQAGPAPMSCEIQGLKEKAKVVDNQDGTFTVSYLPCEAGANLTCTMKYNGEDVQNTPVHLTVRPRVEPEKVKLSGLGATSKTLPASLPTSFEIDASEAGDGPLDVEVLGPDNNKRKVKVISDVGDNKFRATYTPDDVGSYKVNVKYGGKPIGSPVTVKAIPVGNANKCKITEGKQETVQIGQEQCITVNCKDAGNGAVTAKIKNTSTGKDVEVETEKNEDGTYSVYYKPKDSGDYECSLQYGGQPIPNGKYKFKTDSQSSKLEEKEEVVYKETAAEETYIRKTTTTRTSHQSFSTTEFGSGDYHQTSATGEFRTVDLYHISVPSFDKNLVAEVKMPTGKIEAPVIEDNHDGTVNVKYAPKKEGLHELSIKYNGNAIQGSPFSFFVDSISKGPVTAHGPGLTHGISGEPCNFTISTKGAAAAGLQLAVEGPSKADITCVDNKDGTVSVNYLPTSPGEYKVSVKYADKHLRGSPYTVKVTGEGRKRSQISVGSCSEVTFPGKVSDADLRALNAFICAPSGLTEPCFLKKLPNGNIGISFTPREAGDHEVSVRKAGVHIANSPFKLKVTEAEVGDAGKVLVSGAALKEGKTHVDNTFNVVTKNAGYGGLSLSIEGPSKAEINCKDKSDGSLDVSYKPTEPGWYIINLKFADHHVCGSPFTVKVTGQGSNRQRERIQCQRDAVPVTEVGSECRLTFKMPGVTAYELSASVTSPGGVTEDAGIKDVEDGYAVNFVPKELGVHTVSVKLHDFHIPGSPFSFTVGPLKDGGAHRVHAGGLGLEKGEQGIPCEFNVWTREAGAGSLAISVEGPSKAEIDFKDRKDGSCLVSYVVGEPGEYRVGIRFNEEEIPDSPFKVFVSPDSGEAKKVDIGQFPDGVILINKPSFFLVRKNGAKGQLDAKLVSPSGHQDDCFIDTVDFDNYTVRFMPKENGINSIYIKFNGVHIPGSPFRVKVGKDDADPACVHAHGPGLQDVKSGQKTDFFIDTCNAGVGNLSVTVDGPSKVAMDCTENEEGYKVHYTPLCPGTYYIGIRYNGYHIIGSPFKVVCSGKQVADKGDHESSSVVVETVHKTAKHRASAGPAMPMFKSNASRVTSKGMGLKKAYLGKQNQFTVNAADAGNNILYVGLHGPKGPCEEVFLKHMGHHNYQVNYLCKDRGEYMIMVKWGEDHIPGSPFHVEI